MSGPESATRERILSAAAAALSEQSYAATHLAGIARRARVQPPAVYYYFASREVLIGAVMAEGIRRVHDHVVAALAALPQDADVAVQTDTAVRAHLEVELELSDFARAVSRTAGQLPAHLRSEVDVGSERFHDVWRDLLGRAADSGRLRAGLDPRVARMLVVGALNWATEWVDDGVNTDEVIRTAQTMVRRGLFI